MPRSKQRTAIPSLAIQDQRLTPLDLKVLCALCYFEDSKTQTTIAKRHDIAQLLNVHEASVSAATKRLDSFGWVIKVGAGRGTRYHINWINNPAEPSANDEGLSIHNPSETARVYQEKTGETLAKPRGFEDGEPLQPSANGEGLEHKPAEPSVNGEGLNRDNRSDSARVDPVQENHESTISSNIYNKYNIYNTDQIIRSKDDLITFGQAYAILKTHGCPYQFNPNDAGNKNVSIIQSWVDKKHTVGLIIKATELAESSPTRTAPVGPKYVDRCIDTVTRQENAPPKPVHVPFSGDELITFAKGYGITPATGESWEAFRKRVVTEVEKQRRAA